MKLTTFQKVCLKIAKDAILEEFEIETQEIDLNDEQFNKKGSCFVTIKKNNKLRGCIGSISPHRPLEEDIHINAWNAAFEDPRFPEIEKDELEDGVNLGITLLSPIEEKKFENKEELLEFLDKEKCGVVLKFGYRQASLLPSIWDELPKAENFLAHLLQKAKISHQELEKFFSEFEFDIYYGEDFAQDRDKI